MRLFAGDHFPRLAVQSGDLPRPWVMPLGLPRAHRDRLAGLLAQALRALEPDLRLVQLRWAERHALLAGRIVLPSSVLVWWRIDAVPVVDPQAVVIDGSKLTPGLALYDFDQEVSLPAEAWLGPLKIGVLHRIMDRLLDERPVAAYEEIADAVRELAAKLISPIDLVDAAEAMVEVEAQGEGAEAAKAEAISRVIAGRITAEPADVAARAIAAVGLGKELDDEASEALRKAGLADTAGLQTILDLLRHEAILRRALLQIAARRRLEVSIADLAPGMFSEERTVAVQAGADIMSTQAPSPIEGRSPSLPEPQTTVVQQARELILRGEYDAGARVLLRALQHREDSAWENNDLHTAGQLLFSAAAHVQDRLKERRDAATIERVATLHEAVSDLLGRSGAAELAVTACLGAGFAHGLIHRWDEAAIMYERGRALAAATGNLLDIGSCLIGLSDAKLGMGRVQEALESAEEAVRLCRAIGARGAEGAALRRVGDARVQLHELEQAREAYEQAISASDEVKAPEAKASTLVSRGRLWSLQGEFTKSRQDFETALSLCREHKNRPGEATAHVALGELHVRRSEPLRALEAFEEAASIFRDLGDRLREARVLDLLGDVRASMNDLALARDAYEAALERAQELVNRSLEALLFFKCADVRRRSGDRDGALLEYEKALHIYTETGDLAAQGHTLLELGHLAVDADSNWASAIHLYELALARFRESNDREGLGESLRALGMLLVIADRPEEARQVVAEALDVAHADANKELAHYAEILIGIMDREAAARQASRRTDHPEDP